MSPLACRLAELGEDLERPALLRRHRVGCLHCQARAARDHRVQRLLRTLQPTIEQAPHGFAEGVVGALPIDGGPRRRAHIGTPTRVAAAGGAVIAAAAGATALVVWRRGHLPA